MRDIVDVINCKKLDVFAADKLSGGFTDKMAAEARKNLKITKVRRTHLNDVTIIALLLLYQSGCLLKETLLNECGLACAEAGETRL